MFSNKLVLLFAVIIGLVQSQALASMVDCKPASDPAAGASCTDQMFEGSPYNNKCCAVMMKIEERDIDPKKRNYIYKCFTYADRKVWALGFVDEEDNNQGY